MRSNEVMASAVAVLLLAGGPRSVPAAEIQSLGAPELSARRSGSAIISVQGNLIAGRPAPCA